MLTRSEILRHIKETKQIEISPLVEDHIGPNSVDLTLSNKLIIYGDKIYADLISNPSIWKDNLTGREYYLKHQNSTQNVLDMKKDNETSRIIISEEGLILIPGQLYIGSTVEFTRTRGFIPCIETRSSIARLGIMSHLSAGYGDNGFEGSWTLEITVTNPVRIYPGVRICQISYAPIVGRETPYQGKYVNQMGPVSSQIWKDFIKECE